MPENEEAGFKIVDRRASSQEAAKESRPQDKSPVQGEGEKKAGAEKTGFKGKADKTSQKISMPEASFLSLVFTFYTEAQVGLGVIPHPLTQKVEKDLAQAKYAIDILGVLKDKTKGHLTSEEERALSDMLFDLHMKYVEAMKKP